MTALYQWLYYLLPANPILVRIVQGGSRRLRHLWLRMGYLGALILLVLFGLFTGGGLFGNQSLTQLAKAGTWVFIVVSYGQVGAICLLAPIFMAGAIAAEQSGKTFDILLTTPLSNLQIVLGSLLGRLFLVLSLLASGLPLFAVLLIFGGVPIQSVFVSFGVAALSAIMAGSVAITLAVLRAGGRKAVFLFVVSIAGYLIALYAVDVFLLRKTFGTAWWSIGPDSTTWLTPLHPLLVLEASFNSAHYRVPPADALASYSPAVRFYLGRPFEAFALITASLSFLLVCWSAIRVRWVGQREAGFIARSWLGRWLRLGGGGERRREPREVWANPIAWREASTRGNRALAITGRWLFVVAGLAVGGTLLGFYHKQAIDYDTFKIALLTLLLVESAVVVLVAIYMSAGSVSREREDGTLDLLLTTPITPHQYLWGKLRGLVSFLALLLAAPVLTVTMVSVYSIIGRLMHWPQATSVQHTVGTSFVEDQLMLPEAPLLLALLLVPFVGACAIVGISRSLKTKSVMGAVVQSLLVVVGWLLLWSFCGFTAVGDAPIVGAVVKAPSPISGLWMIIDPWANVGGFVEARVGSEICLLLACAVAAAVYGGFVYMAIMNMVKSFDQTVRKLTGVV